MAVAKPSELFIAKFVCVAWRIRWAGYVANFREIGDVCELMYCSAVDLRSLRLQKLLPSGDLGNRCLGGVAAKPSARRAAAIGRHFHARGWLVGMLALDGPGGTYVATGELADSLYSWDATFRAQECGSLSKRPPSLCLPSHRLATHRLFNGKPVGSVKLALRTGTTTDASERTILGYFRRYRLAAPILPKNIVSFLGSGTFCNRSRLLLTRTKQFRWQTISRLLGMQDVEQISAPLTGAASPLEARGRGNGTGHAKQVEIRHPQRRPPPRHIVVKLPRNGDPSVPRARILQRSDNGL